jgi:asparagine synthase (glutamine-hydrolysing)
LGIKPIVYYQDNHHFAFASEIRALTALPDFTKDIDYYSIDQYLAHQYIPAPRTIYRKVKKVLPGHFLVVGFDGEIKANKSYWDIRFKPKTKSTKTWLTLLNDEIRDSVKKHMVSDVEFGAFLSGGIDSTLIVKYMTEIKGEGVKTYTIGFKDSKVDETEWADLVSKKYKTNHTSLTLEGNALEILPKLVKHYGEPFGDFSSVPTYYVSQIAAQDVKMVLSGDGADEAFAGYSHYQGWLKHIDNHKDYFKNDVVRKLYPYAQLINSKRYPKRENIIDSLSNYTRYRTRMNPSFREKLWKADYRYLVDLPNELSYNYETEFKKNSKFSRSQYCDIKVFMPGNILTKVDIASMLNSLEVRTPLTDKTIFELAATIPPELLIKKDGELYHGKDVLKQLLIPDFGHDFVYRKKQGFEIPLDKWLFEGENFIAIKSRFENPEGILLSLFNKDVLDMILSEKRSYDAWLLLVLDEWFKQIEN